MICVGLVIENVPYFCHKSRITCLIHLIQKLNFLMFHCLYYSVIFNESKDRISHPEVLLEKWRSENMQQIYWNTPMSKNDCNKVVLQLS